MDIKQPTIYELRTLVENASRENPHLTTRLEKAAFLVLMRRIVNLGNDRFQVEAEDGLRDYEVVNGHCQCYDYLRHGSGHSCKHRLALAIHSKLQYPDSCLPKTDINSTRTMKDTSRQ